MRLFTPPTTTHLVHPLDSTLVGCTHFVTDTAHAFYTAFTGLRLPRSPAHALHVAPRYDIHLRSTVCCLPHTFTCCLQVSPCLRVRTVCSLTRFRTATAVACGTFTQFWMGSAAFMQLVGPGYRLFTGCVFCLHAPPLHTFIHLGYVTRTLLHVAVYAGCSHAHRVVARLRTFTRYTAHRHTNIRDHSLRSRFTFIGYFVRLYISVVTLRLPRFITRCAGCYRNRAPTHLRGWLLWT